MSSFIKEWLFVFEVYLRWWKKLATIKKRNRDYSDGLVLDFSYNSNQAARTLFCVGYDEIVGSRKDIMILFCDDASECEQEKIKSNERTIIIIISRRSCLGVNDVTVNLFWGSDNSFLGRVRACARIRHIISWLREIE